MPALRSFMRSRECPTIIFTPNEVEGLNIEIARHEMPGLESTEYHNPELVDGLNK